MRLSLKTTQVLKNFSIINEGIVIKKGSELSTMAPNKSMLAKAKVDETFDNDFAIHNLNKFLGVLSFLEKPEINLHKDFLTIEEGETKVTFRYGNPSMIATPPSGDIKMSEDVRFNLQSGVLQNILKALGSMQLPAIGVIGDSTGIHISALDPKNASGDSFSIKVAPTNGHKFKFIFAPTNFKFLNMDYDIVISAKGLMYLKGDGVEYWVPAESNCVYE